MRRVLRDYSVSSLSAANLSDDIHSCCAVRSDVARIITALPTTCRWRYILVSGGEWQQIAFYRKLGALLCSVRVWLFHQLDATKMWCALRSGGFLFLKRGDKRTKKRESASEGQPKHLKKEPLSNILYRTWGSQCVFFCWFLFSFNCLPACLHGGLESTQVKPNINMAF